MISIHALFFALSDLVKMYTEKLAKMGVTLDSKVNSSHFKDNLIKLIPGLKANSTEEGMSLSLIFECGINKGISKA